MYRQIRFIQIFPSEAQYLSLATIPDCRDQWEKLYCILSHKPLSGLKLLELLPVLVPPRG
jgi:hypothetical protein